MLDLAGYVLDWAKCRPSADVLARLQDALHAIGGPQALDPQPLDLTQKGAGWGLCQKMS